MSFYKEEVKNHRLLANNISLGHTHMFFLTRANMAAICIYSWERRTTIKVNRGVLNSSERPLRWQMDGYQGQLLGFGLCMFIYYSVSFFLLVLSLTTSIIFLMYFVTVRYTYSAMNRREKEEDLFRWFCLPGVLRQKKKLFFFRWI